MSENPFFEEFRTPHNAFPFPKFKIGDYEPAFQRAIEEAKANIARLRDQKAEATFENTIVELEHASQKLDEVSTVFFNLLSCEAGEEMHALAQKLSPLLSQYENDITLDEALFRRVKAVYEEKDSLPLESEDIQLLEKTYKMFARNGALLGEDDKQTMRKIDEELSRLWPKFSENVLKATNGYELHVTSEEKLRGIPETALLSAREKAKEKSKEGWVFGLDAPSFLPFMMYCPDEALRKEMWLAFATRAYKGDFDNRANVKRILELKAQRAQLLGFKTHADYVLAERMAESPSRVWEFLNELVLVSKDAAKKEVKLVEEIKKENGVEGRLNPWDFSYFSEKLKKKTLDFDDEELRPYFELDSVVKGVFDHAKKLFSLDFREVDNIPTYHEEVKSYEVYDERNGDFIGLFYADFFPRKTKKSGAWMTSYRGQHIRGDKDHRPHVSIVCNFTKPSANKPSLLTLNEVLTLFHEFGHALHALLSECKYNSLSGTSVYWDFVELPSQIMENWVYQKESLALFAKHYETGDNMPDELIEKIQKSMQFLAGYSSLRQLQFGLLDMSWHTTDPAKIKDVGDFEREVTKECRLFENDEDTNMSCAFNHIFAGGYAAGYYSYKWAEVLDADAFELFQEKGLFSAEIADHFRKHILSRGGSEHPMELYKKFRGREPDPQALLRRVGLV